MDKKTRIMPYNVEAENSVLASMITDVKIAGECCRILSTEDFYLQANQNIFDAINSLVAIGKPIDPVSIEDMLSQAGKLESSGGFDYVVNLLNLISSTASIDYYINILKRTSLSRNLIRKSTDIIDKAYNEPDSKEVLKFAQDNIFAISKEHQEGTMCHIKNSASEVLDKIGEACRGEYKGGTMTGFKHFDNLTNGLKPGELMLLAARPAVGKTAFALNVATNVALNGGRVVVFSLEMPHSQLTSRILSSISMVNIGSLMKGTSTQNATANMRKVMAGYSKIQNTEFYIDDSSVTKPSDIRTKCQQISVEHGKIDLIVVDYLQLMTSDRKTDSRQNEVAELSRSMKILAKELEVPIILLSQLSRAIDQRTDHEPKLSDLRESGAIEQDADIVTFLDKPWLNDKNQPEDLVYLVVAKHRQGELAKLQLRWTGAILRFDAVLENRPLPAPKEIDVPTGIEAMKEVSDNTNLDEAPFISDGISTQIIEDVKDAQVDETDEPAISLGETFIGAEETPAGDNGDLPY